MVAVKAKATQILPQSRISKEALKARGAMYLRLSKEQ